jgi:hypothetical protein
VCSEAKSVLDDNKVLESIDAAFLAIRAFKVAILDANGDVIDFSALPTPMMNDVMTKIKSLTNLPVVQASLPLLDVVAVGGKGALLQKECEYFALVQVDIDDTVSTCTSWLDEQWAEEGGGSTFKLAGSDGLFTKLFIQGKVMLMNWQKTNMQHVT